jgi:hypothetical protein
MSKDPELQAMSEVFDALYRLDESTQKRVVDWVLAKLQSPSISTSTIAKRGPKAGIKHGVRGRKPGNTSAVKVPGAKRGPKSKAKRGLKLGTGGRPKRSGK